MSDIVRFLYKVVTHTNENDILTHEIICAESEQEIKELHKRVYNFSKEIQQSLKYSIDCIGIAHSHIRSGIIAIG